MTTPAPTRRRRAGTLLAALVALALLVVTTAPAVVARPLPGRGWTAAAGDRLLVTTTTQEAVADLGRRPAAWAAADVAVTPLADRVALVEVAHGDGTTVAAELAQRADVVAVEPDRQMTWHAVPDDPWFPAQWAHDATGMPAAWDVTTGGSPLVAVLDSGVDATHPDLAGLVVTQLQSADGGVRPGPVHNDECGYGHGTADAGVLGARGYNGIGITGVVWEPRIIDVALTSQANDCPGGPRESDVVAALHHLTTLDEPPLVVTMSFGAVADTCSAAYTAAISAVRAAGMAVVASAGNHNGARPGIPASCAGVISVGATDAAGQPASYSNHNPHVDLAAPGGDGRGTYGDLDAALADLMAVTCLPGGAMATDLCAEPDRVDGLAGTSFAAPYVAGAVALLRSHVPSLTADQVEAVLENTAVDLGDPGRDDHTGHGLIAVDAALAAAVAGEQLELQPDPPFPSRSVRIAPDAPTTDPIEQAVAVSSGFAAQSAPHVVLARVDDFADALAGSALGYGVGPLLFSTAEGPLTPSTRQALQRVLAPGGTVYLLGGTTALSAAVEEEVAGLGHPVRRLGGDGREATAREVADEVTALRAATDLPEHDAVLVAVGHNWPDAVGAAQLAAYYGIPVLVTPTEALPPITRAGLQAPPGCPSSAASWR